MSKAIALLLDFAKAYDSLDRSFLAQALQHLGFPLKFVHLVKVLHSQTTYKFIVNGFLSRKYNVTSGIRQGCPLAPLLFILALEVLYRKIEESDEIHGVELQAAGCATEVRLGGYADGTAIYLSDPKDINADLPSLSYLSLALAATCSPCPAGTSQNPGGPRRESTPPKSQSVTFMCYNVRNIAATSASKSDKRLRMQVTGPSASKPYASDFDLRVSKLTLSPNAQQLPVPSSYPKCFTWPGAPGQLYGYCQSATRPSETICLGLKEWASSTYITPLDAIPRRPLQLRDNMWTTGAALCASLHSRPYEPRERDNVRWCYEHFKSTIVQTQWDGDVFQIDLSSKMSDRLPGIIAEGRKLRGTFCAEWLPYMTSTADGWLLDSNGSPYKLAHTSLSVGTAQLATYFDGSG
ncbi:reverse transcriptase, partial [Globisporangium splendens]